MTPLIIDGSFGEGGGQILRTSLTLSVLTGQAVEIHKIRAGRSKPGLQPQHLASVRAAASLCAAHLDGDAVGSERLTFTPQAPAAPGTYHFDIGTAGATTLVLQTVLLPLALADAPSRVTVIGGTHVPHAPPAGYLSDVFGALLRRHGLEAEFQTPRVGFTPRGGGILQAEISPSPFLRPVQLVERGPLRSLSVSVITANLPAEVGRRGADAVRKHLRYLPAEPNMDVRQASSDGGGAAVVLVAECENGWAGASAIGARGKPMEQVAQEACREIKTWWKTGAACDEHLGDQLILPMALIPETSRWTTSLVTEHLRTMLWLVPQFVPMDAALEENKDGSGTVTVRGVSLRQGNTENTANNGSS